MPRRIPGPRLIGPLYRVADFKTLVPVDRSGDPGAAFFLTPQTAEAFRVLRDTGLSLGHRIRITSGYRSPEHQSRLFANAVLRYGSEKVARQWVAKFSEHASGQTVDIDMGVPISSKHVDRFRILPAWLWLSAAAPELGWTPYDAEPWHWTFNPDPESMGVA